MKTSRIPWRRASGDAAKNHTIRADRHARFWVTRFLGLAVTATPVAVLAQSQSLTFSGGALLNAHVNFSRLGAYGSVAGAGPETGGAIARNYDDGFNRVDATGNAENTTVNWGYRGATQLRDDQLVLSTTSSPGTLSRSDAGDFVQPSANLEYRGSLGDAGNSDWGLLIGIGYQHIDGRASGTFMTTAEVLEDSYSLNGTPPEALPPAPFEGSPDADVPRIGSVPTRTIRTLGDARVLNGTWALDTDVFPITGGLYLESQLTGRLNSVLSAGILALIISSDQSYRESSTIGTSEPVTVSGHGGSSDFVVGGFVQLGLDWALWDKASLTAAARWQPSESFRDSIDGRRAEIDFASAFAVHAGVSFRF